MLGFRTGFLCSEEWSFCLEWGQVYKRGWFCCFTQGALNNNHLAYVLLLANSSRSWVQFLWIKAYTKSTKCKCLWGLVAKCWGFLCSAVDLFRSLKSRHPCITWFKQSLPVSYRCCSDIIEFMPSSFSLLTCRLFIPAVNNHFSKVRALKSSPFPHAIPWGPQPAWHSTDHHHQHN